MHFCSYSKLRSKYFFTILFISFILSAGQTINAQECDNCSYPKVALYDFAINVPRPAEADSIKKWLRLFFVGPFARGYIRDQYPYGSCITFLDGAMINASEYQDGTLRFGMEYTNLPPSGPVESADYLLTGSVSGANGNYSAIISFEAAYSREVVASGYTTFSTSDPNCVTTAGAALSKQLSPLLKIIKDFEKKKRDTDTKVAIKDLWRKDTPPDIIITPSKKDMDTKETIDVEFRMTDCDGVPLKQREILLTGGTFQGSPLEGPVGGKFTESKLTTDANGVAKAKFTAGDKQCLGVLYAYYIHEKPCGRPAAFVGTAYVNIKRPPAKYFVLNAAVSKRTTYQRDTTYDAGFEGISLAVNHSDHEYASFNAKVTAVVENQTDLPGYFVFNTGEPPISFNANGSRSDFYISKHTEKFNGQMSSGDMRTTNISGTPVTGNSYFECNFDSSEKYFSLNMAFTRQGKYLGHWYGSPVDGGPGVGWQPYDGEYNDTCDGVDPYVISENGNYITKTDSGYSIHYTQNETVKEESDFGTVTRTVFQTIDATLTPYDMYTGVDKEMLDIVPGRYSLAQNYPNPFNPSTKIRYYLPERAFVTLKVFDILGNEIKTLINNDMPKGSHEIEFKSENLSSGIYFYRMQAGAFSSTKKLMLVK